MLDILRRDAAEALPAPVALRPYPNVQPVEAPDEDEVPYVEVGGPNRAIEGSRLVLACPAPTTSLALAPLVTPVTPVTPIVEKAVAALPCWHVVFQPSGRRLRKKGLAAEIIAHHQPDHEISAEYRAIFEALENQLPTGAGRTLLLAGNAPGCGVTTVLLNLAITASRQQLHVAVADANLRRPALADRLGLSATPGLREVLSRTVPLTHALQETGIERLHVLAAGQPGAEIWLPQDGMRGAVRQLRETFDLVIVDAPAWNEGPETALLASICDAVCLVQHQDGDAAPAQPAIPNLVGAIYTRAA